VRDARAAAPDRRARFATLTDEVYEPLQRYLRRRCGAEDADELLDDVLLVLWRRLDDVPPDGAVPWAYGVARRCLANHRRAGDRRLRLLDRIEGLPVAEAVEWTSPAQVALAEALDRLSPTDRELVRLWAWERLEPREIAQVLGISANAASARLGRAQRRLGDDVARHDAARSGQERDGSHEELGR